ncbi:MAG TPA: NYN domain-containing protein, partial [Planctomycetia bacterium]|nr:NYN domain-containing protein [Planctomycetia bacterium]
AATVVFDAREESKSRAKAKSPRQEVVRGVKSIFALGYADADTLIAELAAAHPRPRSLRVVSNDRAVRDAARRARAGSIACQAFQELLASPPRRKPDPPSEDSAGSGEKPSATTAEETAALVKAFESAPVKKSEPQKRADKKAEKAIAKIEKRPAAFDDPALADFYREMLAYSPEKSDGDSGPKRRK